MKSEKEQVCLMHKVLDGDAIEEEKEALKQHLEECPNCRAHFEELTHTEALLEKVVSPSIPEGFTDKVMASLPNEKPTLKGWLHRHPFLVAASLFFFLMMGSIATGAIDGSRIVVEADGGTWVVDEEQHLVTVPKGEVIKGDLIVRNGDLKVNGVVEGDVIIINGNQQLASAGHIAGKINEKNQLFEKIWYGLRALFTN